MVKTGNLAFLALLVLPCAGLGEECASPLPPYFVPASSISVQEALLERGDPIDSVLKLMGKMDTAGCFEFFFTDGSRNMGKLRKTGGFGMSAFEFGTGGKFRGIPIETLAEIHEFRIDEKKFAALKTRAKTNPGSEWPAILGAVGLIFLILLLLDGSGGPFFAGAK